MTTFNRVSLILALFFAPLAYGTTTSLATFQSISTVTSIPLTTGASIPANGHLELVVQTDRNNATITISGCGTVNSDWKTAVENYGYQGNSFYVMYAENVGAQSSGCTLTVTPSVSTGAAAVLTTTTGLPTTLSLENVTPAGGKTGWTQSASITTFGTSDVIFTAAACAANQYGAFTTTAGSVVAEADNASGGPSAGIIVQSGGPATYTATIGVASGSQPNNCNGDNGGTTYAINVVWRTALPSIGPVQSRYAPCTGASCTVTLSNIPSGDTLAGYFVHACTGFTMTATGGYIPIIAPSVGSCYAAVFTVPNVTTGSVGITMTGAGVTAGSLTVTDFHGVSPTTPIWSASSNSANNGTLTPITIGPVPCPIGPCLLYSPSWEGDSGGGAVTPSSGYLSQLPTDGSTIGTLAALNYATNWFQVVSGAGPYSNTASTASSTSSFNLGLYSFSPQLQTQSRAVQSGWAGPTSSWGPISAITAGQAITVLEVESGHSFGFTESPTQCASWSTVCGCTGTDNYCVKQCFNAAGGTPTFTFSPTPLSSTIIVEDGVASLRSATCNLGSSSPTTTTPLTAQAGDYAITMGITEGNHLGNYFTVSDNSWKLLSDNQGNDDMSDYIMDKYISSTSSISQTFNASLTVTTFGAYILDFAPSVAPVFYGTQMLGNAQILGNAQVIP